MQLYSTRVGILTSPILPILQIDKNKDNTYKLWVHTNVMAERLDLYNKKSIELLDSFESFPQKKNEQFLNDKIYEISKFKVGQVNDAISLCLDISNENEIINWSFQLTKVNALLVENKHLDALLTRKILLELHLEYLSLLRTI